jgi:hypothetical protein
MSRAAACGDAAGDRENPTNQAMAADGRFQGGDPPRRQHKADARGRADRHHRQEPATSHGSTRREFSPPTFRARQALLVHHLLKSKVELIGTMATHRSSAINQLNQVFMNIPVNAHAIEQGRSG